MVTRKKGEQIEKTIEKSYSYKSCKSRNSEKGDKMPFLLTFYLNGNVLCIAVLVSSCNSEIYQYNFITSDYSNDMHLKNSS